VRWSFTRRIGDTAAEDKAKFKRRRSIDSSGTLIETPYEDCARELLVPI
jgi:hypothetical protein